MENENMFGPLNDDHYPDAQHGDTVSARVHQDDDGTRWLQSIPTAKDSGIKSEDIKSATAVKPGGGSDKSFDLGKATDSLMNSIKKYNKTYYSDEQ